MINQQLSTCLGTLFEYLDQPFKNWFLVPHPRLPHLKKKKKDKKLHYKAVKKIPRDLCLNGGRNERTILSPLCCCFSSLFLSTSFPVSPSLFCSFYPTSFLLPSFCLLPHRFTRGPARVLFFVSPPLPHHPCSALSPPVPRLLCLPCLYFAQFISQSPINLKTS